MLRHAPARTDGRLCGRTDVPAVLPPSADAGRLAEVLAGTRRRVTSPALRCLQTAGALWPGPAVPSDPRLWEQDFGDWDGRPAADIPDLGPLSRKALAEHRPPGGESFHDLCARVWPALEDAAGAGDAAVVAHAGTVRAALALALGDPADALAFEIAPLSVTRLVRLGDASWSVRAVNWTLPQ